MLFLLLSLLKRLLRNLVIQLTPVCQPFTCDLTYMLILFLNWK